MVATIGMIVPDLFGRFGGDLSPSMGLTLGLDSGSGLTDRECNGDGAVDGSGRFTA